MWKKKNIEIIDISDSIPDRILDQRIVEILEKIEFNVSLSDMYGGPLLSC